ncbi:MAG: hypothetical protein QOH93_1436 [Chloroflexia bacterium]|jgi:hypothetical protein|nr:hypothetical protein [Chloroflexia bacterium]
MVSRVLFGVVLGTIGLLYLWLAFEAIQPGMANGDWVSYLGAVLFLAAGVGAGVAGVNLVRAKRR